MKMNLWIKTSGNLLAVAACALALTAAAADFKQAPVLDELVKSGKLPPVAQRLPAAPFVETMVDGVGKYGGTIRSGVLGGGDQYNLVRTLANENLVCWTPDWTRVVPSIAGDGEGFRLASDGLVARERATLRGLALAHVDQVDDLLAVKCM